MKTNDTPLSMRVPASWLAALDAWRAAQAVPPSRIAAIRVAVDRLIAEQGTLHTAEAPSAAPKRREKVLPAGGAELPPGKRQCSKCGELVAKIGLHECKPKGTSK